MLIFRQLFDPQSSTYTYLLGDRASGAAVLIDPVFEQARRDAALIGELGLTLIATLETHVHADHVTGACLLKRRTGSRIMLSTASGAEGADRTLAQDDVVVFGGRRLMVRATPGHTNGCLTYVLDDHSMAFTGDCLLIRGSGRTDFQEGDAAAMYRSIHEQIFTLPDDCLLYPAHDYRGLTVTSVAEERRFNPRIGGEIGIGDFTGYMKNLRLAHPKLLDVAVPANLRPARRRRGDESSRLRAKVRSLRASRRPAAATRCSRPRRRQGDLTMKVSIAVNGESTEHDVEPRVLLVHYLREVVGLTGTNVGCDTSSCGACTVHLDGEAVKSCTVLAVQADGHAVTTIEGLAHDGELHPMQEAFRENHGLQCGFCTPGMVMAATSLVTEGRVTDERSVREGLEGNLCRCTGYHNIVQAVLAAGGVSGAPK